MNVGAKVGLFLHKIAVLNKQKFYQNKHFLKIF